MTAAEPSRQTAIGLSVVVPVYNQAAAIGENVRTIRERVARGMDEPIEVIVVSDGSIDRTEERALESATDDVRVIHYDRNLGKGYAVKVGALEARGRWIGYVDADLDLDPARLPEFVAVAERDGLDLAIGSKRHPSSDVEYPRSRRVASWLYQQLVRVLFQLDVRDTQVGLKVFRREIAERVLPLLLVKRYAFDLELLAVSRALGFDRIAELPVKLEYQFSGSGVRSHAVLRALVDTAAIFYRLRILRYYQRKQRLVGAYGWTRPRSELPTVTVVGTAAQGARLDYPALEVEASADEPRAQLEAARRARSELVAFFAPAAVPAVNWLSATVPFLSRPEVGAVVTSALAPATGDLRSKAAAAIRESRLGGGRQYFRFLPGNLRFVDDFPGHAVVTRRDLYLELAPLSTEELCGSVHAHGGRVLYTPESVVVSSPPPLFRPHLAWAFERGRLRRRRGLRPSTLPPVLLLLVVAGVWILVLRAAGPGPATAAVGGAYVAVVVWVALVAGLRFRSLHVAGLTAPGFVLTHLAAAAGFVVGRRG